MKRKIIEQRFLKNEMLLEQKIISKEESFNSQFELLEEVRKEIEKLEQLDFGIFKIIRSMFFYMTNSKNKSYLTLLSTGFLSLHLTITL